jgi:hypothetical protein
MGELDALPEAQIWLLHNPNELRAAMPAADHQTGRTSPAFWAAFPLSGEAVYVLIQEGADTKATDSPDARDDSSSER